MSIKQSYRYGVYEAMNRKMKKVGKNIYLLHTKNNTSNYHIEPYNVLSSLFYPKNQLPNKIKCVEADKCAIKTVSL